MNNHLETTIKEFNEKYFISGKNALGYHVDLLFPAKIEIKEFLIQSHINYLKRERDYWVKIFDSKPDRNKELIYDTVAQNFARIEIERKEEEISQAEQLLGNKE